MNKKLIIVFAALIAIMAVMPGSLSAEQPEKVTVVVVVEPAMDSQDSENNIKTNLRFERGVTDISTDLSENIVVVTFDSRKTDKDKIFEALSKIGYQAKEKN